MFDGRVTESQFNIQMERLYAVFGEKSFTEQRNAITWKYVGGLPYTNFIKIIDHFIGSFRYAPLPEDFKIASISERRSMAGSIGIIYAVPDVIKCRECDDLGILRVNHLRESIEMLVRCVCNASPTDKLPIWNEKKSGDWIKSKCPIDWFKPKQNLPEDDNKALKVLWPFVESWKAKLKFAEEFWVHQ